MVAVVLVVVVDVVVVVGESLVVPAPHVKTCHQK